MPEVTFGDRTVGEVTVTTAMNDKNDREEVLEALKTELTERLRLYAAHQHREAGSLDKDMEEQALQVQNDEVVDFLEEEAHEELEQVEKALARIASGKGGHCEHCGSAIPPDRLGTLPYTTRCIRCAGNASID